LANIIYQVIPGKGMVFNRLIPLDKQQYSQEVVTKVTRTRNIFAKKFTSIKTAIEEECYVNANITPNEHDNFQIHPSDMETEAITLTFTHMEWDKYCCWNTDSAITNTTSIKSKHRCQL